MIPKVIHFCWFGRKKKPALVRRCIDSWRKNAPDYHIVQWNEDSFDINKYPYTAFCYQRKQYAFLSDFVRLAVVYQYGGIYLDTDVELIKSLDPLLGFKAFYGFENKDYIATGLGFGAEKGHITVKRMLDEYLRLKPDTMGEYSLVPCPRLNTESLLELGLVRDGSRQTVFGAEILPAVYMNPYDDPTGVLSVSEETISIHWYGKSWMPKTKVLRSKITKPFHRVFGVDVFKKH